MDTFKKASEWPVIRGFYDTICIFADFLMDDAALVAIVGGGEVTPIHLIIYEEKRVFDSRALLRASTLACATRRGVFHRPLLAYWPTRVLLKRRTRTGMPRLYVCSSDYFFRYRRTERTLLKFVTN